MAFVLRRAIVLARSSRLVMSRCASSYETLEVTQPSEFVTKVTLNRPDKSNAMNTAFWREMRECFGSLATDPDTRVVVLTGNGKNFTAGLDLIEFAGNFSKFTGSEDAGRTAFAIREMVKPMQDSFTAMEKCPKPVISVVHGACIGGGMDMITATDIRIASKDAYFQIKEVDIGLAADVGTLQRLPKIVGNDSLVRELVYTARKFSAQEAFDMGLLSGLFDDKKSAESAGIELAKVIASKSPIAVQGSKVNLVYSRDNSVEAALDYAGMWNSAMLQTEDVLRASQAMITKQPPTFSKL